MFLKIILILIVIVVVYVYNKYNRLTLLSQLILLRGILAPNCHWFKISDLILSDPAGVNLYNNYKTQYKDFAPIKMFGKKLYLVTNNKYMKTILYNSPDLFNVGKLKKIFFKSFMAKNVGVSQGCPWKYRRYINETALVTDKLHIYAEKYNNDIIEQIKRWNNKTTISYKDFLVLGKNMVSKIVFNAQHINDDVFKIFSKANSIQAFYNPNFKIDSKTYKNYVKTLNYYINKPNKNSLIELCLSVTKDKEEVFHQIPHFIFPIVGLYVSNIPRLLLLLCNHENDFKKVIQEVYSLSNPLKLYKLQYLRKCILETLRLNNPVITTFRTLEKDYTFDNKHSFKKGTQFVILNNPVLRDMDFFKQPNKFIPSRWTPEMEKSDYAISFSQGPQRCPGKELAIYLMLNFIYNLIKIKIIGKNQSIITKKIDTKYISQVINPCNIQFSFSN
tara:strand:+ start:1178 stop:2512 length:1335 start_codon:yes stop_codon:yes gene_type:complete